MRIVLFTMDRLVEFMLPSQVFGTFAFDSKANYDLGGKVKPNYVWGLYLNF